MTSLDTVLGTLTGPRRLRSALRQKTVAIKRTLSVLAGPTELCVRIPASVFGGDIFGVMSTQLRDALIEAQAAPAPEVHRERRRLAGVSGANSGFQNSQNSFPSAVEHQSLRAERVTANHEVSSRALLGQSENTSEKELSGAVFSPAETNIFRKGMGDASLGRGSASPGPAWQGSGESMKSGADLRPSSTKHSTTATLVSSLNRYWQALGETRNTSHANPHALAESSANADSFVNAASLPVTDAVQRTASRPWPNVAGRDVAEKLRSFTNNSNPLQKSTRLSSAPDPQIQNVFNIEVNHANQHDAAFDDLGDRLAQILHEQALQHGIDVT